MKTVFERSPLAEAFLEIRWLPSNAPAQTETPGQQAITFMAPGTPLYEKFYEDLGTALANHGYTIIERLIPKGMPEVLFKVTSRYINPQNKKFPVSFQLGPGVFTANGNPPYEWEEFILIVEKGIACFLEARPDKDSNFISISLRYINSFTKDYWTDNKPEGFIDEAFNIKVEYPDSIVKYLKDTKKINPRLQFSAPLEEDMTFNFSLFDAFAGNEPTIILDIGVLQRKQIAGEASDFSKFMEHAHNVLHDTFFDMTKPIHSKMKPFTKD